MLPLPVPQKFNTFNTFTTFHNYHLASRAVGMPSVIPGNLHEGSHHVQLQNAMPRGHVFHSVCPSLTAMIAPVANSRWPITDTHGVADAGATERLRQNGNRRAGTGSDCPRL